MKDLNGNTPGPSVPEYLILNAPLVPNTAGQVSQRYRLPEGWFWELLSVSVGVAVGAAVTDQPGTLSAADGQLTIWSTTLTEDLPVAGFVGIVTWARHATGRSQSSTNISITPIPQSIIQGGWVVDVVFQSVGNNLALDPGVLVARAIAPVARRTEGVFVERPM